MSFFIGKLLFFIHKMEQNITFNTKKNYLLKRLYFSASRIVSLLFLSRVKNDWLNVFSICNRFMNEFLETVKTTTSVIRNQNQE